MSETTTIAIARGSLIEKRRSGDQKSGDIAKKMMIAEDITAKISDIGAGTRSAIGTNEGRRRKTVENGKEGRQLNWLKEKRNVPESPMRMPWHGMRDLPSGLVQI